MNKSRSSIFLIALMVSSLVLFGAVHFGTAQSGTTFQGWQVENGGGQYSQNNGIMSLSGNNGTYVILYEPIAPTTDFNFSLQVNAATLEGFAIMLRSSLPFAGSTAGVNFEFGARDGGTFLLARWTTSWIWNEFVSGAQQNLWYTMILSVNQNPFAITATVLDQNGTLLGSYTASDMTNLDFNNIAYLGFGVLESGGNYTVENISATNTPIPSTPTPTPTSTPTPTPAPNLPSPNLSFYCISSSTTSGFNVQIQGSLTYNGVGLSGAGIQLSDSVTGGATWQDLTYVNTGDNGSFTCVWNPSVSGNYGIEATWSGDNDYSNASALYNFAIAPFNNQEQNVFSVTSNSTLTSLAFNSTTNELSFGVSGPSGTTGVTQVCIPQSLIPDISKLNVMLDGASINYTSVSQGNVWLITFTYHHSSHTIVIALGSSTSTVPEFPSFAILSLVIILAVSVAVVLTLRKRKIGKAEA